MNFDVLNTSAYLNQYVLIELAVVIVSISASYYFFASKLQQIILDKTKVKSKILVDGIIRILFPLGAIILIGLAQSILSIFFVKGLLVLAQKLLAAMIFVRIAVYLIRFLSKPNSILRALEKIISFSIWILIALQITGILPDFLATLDDITFKIGSQTLSLLTLTQALVAIFLAILIAMTISKFIENKLMKSKQLDANAKVMIGKVFRIFLYFIAIVVSLSSFGINLTFLSVLGGAFGVGLAFGMQNIASNYITGFIILMDKSIRIGDVLTIDGHYGMVTLIRSRYTVLKKLDGVEVIIPNEKLMSQNIINHSLSDRKARVSIDIQISYTSSVDKAFKIMLNAANSEKRVIDDPEPVTYLIGFGDNGIDLSLAFYILDPEEGSLSLKSDINRRIWKDFQEQGIEIPYPHRTVEIINK